VSLIFQIYFICSQKLTIVFQISCVAGRFVLAVKIKAKVKFTLE